MSKLSLSIAVLFVLVATAFSQAAHPPKLLIVISVDQMRPDYLSRFSHQLHGGLGKLFKQGIVLDNCMLNYSGSETGPGHSVIVSGVYPNRTGIAANHWYGRLRHDSIYCVYDKTADPVEGAGGGISPGNLAVTTLGDWLKAFSPLSKVVSISLKDRAAVLFGGKFPDAVVWYGGKKNPKWVSSSYYGTALPAFAREFNKNDIMRCIPDAWTRLDDVCDKATTPDSMRGERLWLGRTTFPHELPDSLKSSMLQFTPFGDSLTLAVAKEALKDMKLGSHSSVDLLCLSLSCTDYIGHYYGPNSCEMCDQIKRLDRYLGNFFSSVDSLVGPNNYAVTLTSDHGIGPLPEYAISFLGKKKTRVVLEREVLPQLLQADSTLRKRLGVDEQLLDLRGFLNYAAANRAGVSPMQLQNEVRNTLLQLDFVGDVFFRDELVNDKPPKRKYFDQYKRSYYAATGPDVVLHFKESVAVIEAKYADDHGTPSRDDTHVPLIFWRTGLKPSHSAREAHSVDIAPTLARLLGLKPLSATDGKVLVEVTREFSK